MSIIYHQIKFRKGTMDRSSTKKPVLKFRNIHKKTPLLESLFK